MAKAKAKQTDNPPAELIEKAVAEGQELIKEGKTKIEAAMAIYRVLEQQGQQVIVDAFVTGANLTEKGALTYWYNCRRRLAKERRETHAFR